MKRKTGQKILLLFLSFVFVFTIFPTVSLAAPKGTGTSNCWGSGGQLEIQLSGCSGYKSITVVAEFSGKIESATGWGFDSYVIKGNQVTATCSSTGSNSWGFDNKVGIQVTGSDVNSAKLVSVSGDGESGSVNETQGSTAPQTSGTTAATEPANNPDPARNTKGVEGDDWLTTEGSHIVDKDGKEVWLTGCNWFGYNTGTNLFDGVWNCNLKDTIKAIADRGFNVLRVPMSAELLLQWKKGEYPRANYNNAYNEELNSMNSLEIFDYVLSLCEKNGMKVIIDIHTVKTDASGHNHPVWYREDMTVVHFVDSLSWIAERYKNNDTIIGYDLKNEPHGKASETPHAIWNGSDDKDNWKWVAEIAGRAVLEKNPNALIIIEGIQIYPKDIKSNNFVSKDDDNDYYNTWWGANLMGVKDYPIDFGSPELNKQIVYSPHDYGPRVYEQPWFKDGFTYESLYKDAWHDYWLYIAEDDIAPIFVGEWGGFMEGDNLKWMEYFRQLIAEKHLHHTFWCFNANSGDTGGLVKDDFKTWDEEKYNFVKAVLWQTEDGKFIGLDHAVPLGANGIALGDYDGVIITPAPAKPKPNTRGTETITETTEEPGPTCGGVIYEEKSDLASNMIRKASTVLITVVIIAVVLIGGIIALTIFLKKRSDARKAGEKVVPLDPSELEDANITNVAETGKEPDDAQEDS